MTLNEIKIRKKTLKGELYYFLAFDFKPIKEEVKRCVIELRKGMPEGCVMDALHDLIKMIRES